MVDLTRYRPEWNSIATKFLTEQILVEFNQCIDVVLAGFVYEVDHSLKVGLVELTLFGLDAGPHDSESKSVDALGF